MLFISTAVKIFYDDLFLGYSHSGAHPESPERLRYTVDRLKQSGSLAEFLHPRHVSMESLLDVHAKKYVDGIKTRSIAWTDDETPVYHNTFQIASLSAGAAIDALNTAVQTGERTLAFIRPPGHHSGVSHGGGFCYFNNVAIAAKQAGLGKIAIVDIDVHHGNGTSEIFYDSNKVLYISTHERGIYPGTGAVEEVGIHKGEGFNLNIPLRAGSGDATFREAFDSIIIPVVSEYRPDAIIVSLGMDSHYMDPLASLSLSTKGYLYGIARLTELPVPSALVLEGGYCVEAVYDVIEGVLQGSNEQQVEPRFSKVKDTKVFGLDDIFAARERFEQYWRL